MTVPTALLLLSCLATLPATAARSTSFVLDGSTLDAGGRPLDGAAASSARFHLSADAVGAPFTRTAAASASFRLDAGFVASLAPPGEVNALLFDSDRRTLRWAPARAAVSYNVYRDLLAGLPGQFGACLALRIAGETWVDDSLPGAPGYFYLVTARNGLDEEGSKGASSDGTERQNATPCP